MRDWNGRDVRVLGGLGERETTGRTVSVELTNKAARTLALSLMRLKQTTITLPAEAQEFLDAINYVTVGDPASNAAYARMEAGKGMTPDGGYRKPTGPRYPQEGTINLGNHPKTGA